MKYIYTYIIFLITTNCFSQQEIYSEKKLFIQNNSIEDVYIFIDSRNFFGSKGEYRTHFSIISKDSRFSHDNYNFIILDPKLEERNIYQIGEQINIDSINYITPNEYFKDKSFIETHNELSLIKNQKRIFIITYINDRKKHMAWNAKYDGTIRDVTYTQLGKGPFRTEQ
ncbi:hypothetical protein [Lacinutrix jangbogonensis]|uniref:hypothetical protein n=1 Tax=Lacinutrix jangbogonensis TaxID=1469557 RepID=UPI00053D20AE|nr:hypothetical protein [Lacinutrix jangbogonensis]